MGWWERLQHRSVDEPEKRDLFGAVDDAGVDHVPRPVVHLRHDEAAVEVDLLDVGNVSEEEALPGDHDRAWLWHLALREAHAARVPPPHPGVPAPRNVAAAGDVPRALAIDEFRVGERAQVRRVVCRPPWPELWAPAIGQHKDVAGAQLETVLEWVDVGVSRSKLKSTIDCGSTL